MTESTLEPASQSSGKRNLGFVKLRRGLKEHLHRSRMSSNASTLFVWLLLSAYHSGPKRGCVEANYDDLMRGLGWAYSMVRRTVEELESKGYIEVLSATNQHQVTTIRILNFDGEACDSAVSTGEHTKPTENSAVLSGVLSAVSTGEKSGEHSNPSISQSKRDLQVPKNAVEVKKEKNGKTDAVRRPFDAELPVTIPPFRGASRLQKKQNLIARLAAKIQDDGSFLDYIEDCKKRGREHPFGIEEREAFAATGYDPDLNSPLLGFDFVINVREVYDDNRGKGVSPGNLCSKIIDYCERERKSCEGGNHYPPDFVEHRNKLRARERVAEQQSGKSVGVRA